MSVSNTYPPVLHQLCRRFGGVVYEDMHTKTRENCRPCWRWGVSGKKARRLLRVMYPLLQEKAQQALWLLIMAATPKFLRNGMDAELRAMKRPPFTGDEGR